MGREVVTTWLRHEDSGSCPANFFTSFSGNRIGILFVIFIRFFVCLFVQSVGSLRWHTSKSKNL